MAGFFLVNSPNSGSEPIFFQIRGQSTFSINFRHCNKVGGDLTGACVAPAPVCSADCKNVAVRTVSEKAL
jgi:hypothetical protein